MDSLASQRARIEVCVVKALAQVAANTNRTPQPKAAPSREFLERQAFEALKAFISAVQSLLYAGDAAPTAPVVDTNCVDDPPTDVINAEEAAAFLGVDRNTVYDFANRGVIPHQRLGKRLLFR